MIEENGKKRIIRTYMILTREYDADAVELDDILLIGDNPNELQVNDFFESEWKYGLTIIAEDKY